MTREEKVEYKYVLINAIENAEKTISRLAGTVQTANLISGKDHTKKQEEQELEKCRVYLQDLLRNMGSLESDSFGNCRTCGKEIKLTRLAQHPEVNTCGFC